MELRMVAKVLLRYWWLILAPTLVALVIVAPDLLNRSATAGGFTTVLRYSAAQEPEAQPARDGDFQDIWLASELTVNAFTAWVQTDSFREEMALVVGPDIDLAPLGIAADNERSIGQLFLSHPDSEALQAVTDAAVEVLRTRNQAYFPQVGSAPAEVTLLDDPVITAVPPPLTNRFAPLIRVALGLLVGLGLAFLAHYLDPTLRDREELESLGLPVIGTLPREP